MAAPPSCSDSATRSRFAPLFERRDARGQFTEILREGPWHTVVTGTMRSGAVMGNHYHKRTRIALYLMSGRAAIEIVHVKSGERRALEVRPGEGAFLETGEAHAIRFMADSQFLLLKSHPYSEDNADTFPWAVSESA